MTLTFQLDTIYSVEMN